MGEALASAFPMLRAAVVTGRAINHRILKRGTSEQCEEEKAAHVRDNGCAPIVTFGGVIGNPKRRRSAPKTQFKLSPAAVTPEPHRVHFGVAE